jgi:hypothetical protein
MNYPLKYSKLIVAILLLSSLSCKRDTAKNIENTMNSEIEKTDTAAQVLKETTNTTIENTSSKPATTNKETIENGIKKIPVVFNTGSTKKVIEDQITGREIRDYIFNIKEGQRLKFVLVPSSGMPYFNLMEPGEDYTAIYNSSINGNQYEGVSNKSGAYTLRVYFMRNAARRNEVGKYNLLVSIE